MLSSILTDTIIKKESVVVSHAIKLNTIKIVDLADGNNIGIMEYYTFSDGVLDVVILNKNDRLLNFRALKKDKRVTNNGPVVIITDISVVSPFRNGGFGKTMLDELISDNDCDILLQVFPTEADRSDAVSFFNEYNTLVSFYLKRGFNTYPVENDYSIKSIKYMKFPKKNRAQI
jgi:hypothetical protein